MTAVVAGDDGNPNQVLLSIRLDKALAAIRNAYAPRAHLSAFGVGRTERSSSDGGSGTAAELITKPRAVGAIIAFRTASAVSGQTSIPLKTGIRPRAPPDDPLPIVVRRTVAE